MYELYVWYINPIDIIDNIIVYSIFKWLLLHYIEPMTVFIVKYFLRFSSELRKFEETLIEFSSTFTSRQL